MLLTGSYPRTLDGKLRLALPKPFREALDGKQPLILSFGMDGSLTLYSHQAFQDLADKLAARSPTAQDVRAFSRLLYAQSHHVELDPQGRIRVPADLARQAALESEVMLIGLGDRVELWNRMRWEAYFSQVQPRFDELAETTFRDRPPTVAAVPSHDETRPTQPR